MVDAPFGVPSGDGSRGSVGALSRVDVPVAEKLRNLADWLDAHPSVCPSYVQISAFDGEVLAQDYTPETAEDLAVLARSVGGKWEKVVVSADSLTFSLRQEVMPGYVVSLVTWRASVCTKVVTGTREVEVPDPDAPLVKVTEDVVEWRCDEPLLAREAS